MCSSRDAGSILYKVDDVIETWLGIAGNNDYGHASTKPRYSSETAAKTLTKKSVSKKGLFPAKKILDVINNNWEAGGHKRRSKKNWKWEPKLKMSPNNTGEKELEKLAAFLLGDDDWTNQIPVCSGLMPEKDEVKRAIDIGRKIFDKEFEFIELKFKRENGDLTGDSHPLYAALELLEYGILYVFARKIGLIRKQKKYNLRQAEIVKLVVLGPRAWYDKYDDFQWLSDAINKGLSELLGENGVLPDQKLEMSLTFRELSKDFIVSYPRLQSEIESFRQNFSKYQPVVK